MSYDIVTSLERLGSGANDDRTIASEGAEEILRLRSIIRKAIDEAQSYDGTITGMVKILAAAAARREG